MRRQRIKQGLAHLGQVQDDVLVVLVLVRELCRPFAKCFCGALEREGKTLSINARQRSQRPSFHAIY